MKLRSITKLKKIQNQRVLLRVDFNVKLGSDMRVDSSEDFKIRRILPTIKYLTERGARLVIMTHLGRPGGKSDKSLLLDPISNRLSSLLSRKIHKLKGVIGSEVITFINNMQPGQIVMLGNLRFEPGEQKNSLQFAKDLASLGDVYVNDAFAVSHHPASSLIAITKYLPSYAGLLLQSEVSELSRVIKHPKKPLLVILGGAKIGSKLDLIEKIAKQADWVLIGGGLANNFLAGLGYEVGKSLVDKQSIAKAKNLYQKYQQKILLPLDVTVDDVATKTVDAYQKNINEIKPTEKIIDVGTRTVLAWSQAVKLAKTIFWNGPLGIVEDRKASHASRALTELIAARSKRKCFTVVGGGETVWLIQVMDLFDDFDYISTGGGAMLDFLQNGTLPALEPLQKNFF